MNDVTFDVRANEAVAVLGNNGAGKSTLLRAISGTLSMHGGRVDSGSVKLDGNEITNQSPAQIVKSRLVHVPEGRQVFTRLTVEENLRAGEFARRHDRLLRSRLEHAFEMFPILAERRTQRAGLLSGGQQQMLAIARGLISNPRLILLDEPSLGLAPILVDQVADVVRSISRAGTTVVLVEQNAAMALSVASRAYVLSLGEVSLTGSAEELKNSERVRALYLGGEYARRGTD
ncbi:MAG: ABC transporter ATP-binding protein [Acidimicrobiia bacterium]